MIFYVTINLAGAGAPTLPFYLSLDFVPGFKPALILDTPGAWHAC